MGYLNRIQKPNDIKKIPPKAYGEVAEEIRNFLIGKVSVSGGHLASNLGVVELTMALHLVLDLPKDKILWDVGHQSYTHKLLTGRRDGFDSLRQMGGMSGFPKRAESDCDVFDSGHSSTSLSAALGMVRARELSGGDETIVAVIGDGAMTGGLAYEALNNVSQLSSNLIIVLNDNNMSISENVGGLSKYLRRIRTSQEYVDLRDRIHDSLQDRMPMVARGISRAKQSIKSLVVPGMFFEEMGITYLGPVDGHNVQEMVRVFTDARRLHKCVLVHVRTKKGAGYEPARKHPARFHGTPPFDVATGKPLHPSKGETCTGVFSGTILEIARKDPCVVAVTAAMADGVGLAHFRTRFPNRFFDVGIAEQHAVTFAAGLAAGGMKPVFAVYSTFLQRAYDQILEDVCLQELPVVFAIDRAGIVGADGETHQGIFDLSYLSTMPGMTIMAPKNGQELADMLRFAVSLGKPAAVRYPRGQAYDGLHTYRAPLEIGKAEMVFEEGGILLLAAGSMVECAVRVREILQEDGVRCSLANARFVKPLDTGLLAHAASRYALLVTMEENVASGGFGEHVAAWYAEQGIRIPLLQIAIPDSFVPHGSPAELMRITGIDPESVAHRIRSRLAGSGSEGPGPAL